MHDKEGNTVLHYAARNSNYGLVSFLSNIILMSI
ncbi:ankyrin repeat domain-containing protein [Wolbachia endosymbiont of Atemnus politus]